MVRVTFWASLFVRAMETANIIAAGGALAIDSYQPHRRDDDIVASRRALRRSMHATGHKTITLPGLFLRQQFQQHLVRSVAVRLGEAFFEQRQVFLVNVFFHAHLLRSSAVHHGR
jgi:hypothetical protein